MEQNQTKPTALLLGGGGAKGAFQIGAWRALAEAGMLTDIRAAAGCSVGALNAVLFAIGDWDFAKNMWEQIQPSDLLAKGSDGAFFSRDGLIRLINQLPLERINDSGIRVHVCVHDIEANQPVYYELNGLPRDSVRTLLLASSAIPHIYAPERYLGRDLMDGSVTPEGDLCIQPVYAQGHRELIAVTLKPNLSLYGGSGVGNGNLIQQYADCNFTLIKPLRPMGNLLTGTLNFTQDKIRSRMEQGYNDTKTALNGINATAPQSKEEINAILTEKMQRLFPTSALLAGFLREYGSRFAPNVQFPTLGGTVFYDNIFEVEGWRLQQQRTVGMQVHYRFLDANNVRVAWVLQPQQLLDALTDYEAVRELRNH